MDLKIFATLSAKQFATDARYFASEKRADLVNRFRTWATNCVAKVIEYGDIKWANKASAAAELCGFGPTFRRVYVPNVCFAYDKEAHLFTGTIQAGKRAALAELNEDGILNFEADIAKRLADEGKPKEKKEVDYAKRLSSAVTAALKHGMSAADAKKLVSETISKTITTVAAKKAA
jgi:hypothetical protein